MKIQSTLTKKNEIFLHVVFWIIWLYFRITAIDREGHPFIKTNLFVLTGSFVTFITFYLNYLIVLPKVFKPFHLKKVFLGILCIYTFFIGFRYFIEQFLTKLIFERQNYSLINSTVYYIYDNLFTGIKPIILSTIFWLILLMIRLMEYNKNILEESKISEIKFLKSQINPHFIFNTLNNIYSLVYFQSNKALPAIEKLSQIMRFTTYESQKIKIKLLDEVDYIRAYISLEQLRHENYTFVNLRTKIENENTEIPPYVLSPLVENAIKHGHASNENPIEINLKEESKKIIFIVENQIGRQKKDKLGGIGLDNLKRRLELHYPDTHKLSLINNNNSFNAKLQIDLK